jgi:hypothetical protein
MGDYVMNDNINKVLSKFKESDVYALICGYLYEFKEIPEYSIISELAYLLSAESFVNLITYFEGQTFKIPTKAEFQNAIRTLLLLQYFEIEGKPWKDSLVEAGFDTSDGRAAQIQLNKLKATLDKYRYGNRNY